MPRHPTWSQVQTRRKIGTQGKVNMFFLSDFHLLSSTIHGSFFIRLKINFNNQNFSTEIILVIYFFHSQTDVIFYQQIFMPLK